jgi:signal transduction histidine kinase
MAPAKPFLSSSVRWTLAMLALFVLAAGTIVTVLLWRTNNLLTGQVLAVIAAEARGLNDQYRNGGLPLLVRTVNERAQLPGGGLYLLIDGAGVRLAGNLAKTPAEIREDPSGGLFRYVRDAPAGNPELNPGPRLAVGMPIRILGSSPGDTGQQSVAQLFVARDIEDTRAFAQATRSTFLTGIGAMSLLMLVGAALYGRGLGRRVDAVTAASQRIMAGDLGQRLPVAGHGDEIDRLSASLNIMLDRIEQLMTGLKEVSDNIAHDLKTPLTRLRNRADAALRDAKGAPAYRDGLERTIEEADELIKTFNALLSIARLEAGASDGQAELVDLAAITRDAVELYEPVAEEAGLRFVYVPPSVAAQPGLPVRGDRQLIGQTLANLIENAMKYGCDGARGNKNATDAADITIAVAARAGWADVSVADRGPGIAASDRGRALKRFVRLDASRTRPGTGLGLSLVAAVARAHHGTVRLEDNEPGLRVVLSLPLAEA